ncbi:unnamed protein product [Brassicogethes aeneus]|uniref:Aladin seven-bladed propeller domain-containing protein n=1 Tax=Brassicogethes aeneus TaxID=1431903 RepID=A0A9P0B7R8_BRAAE|nr:unnamed protein product [Brassicogethes aeneus]
MIGNTAQTLIQISTTPIKKMRNLQDFEVPNDGEISVCEINGRMQSMNLEYANVNAFTTSVEKHPKIHITRDLLHPVSSGDEGRALFLPVDVPFLKQLTQVYYEQGFYEALHIGVSSEHIVVSKGSRLLLNLLNYVRKVQVIFNPNIRYSSTSLINNLSQTKNWQENTIRCIAWHPYYTKVAVATCDDSVRVYSSETNFTPLLRCKQQKNVTCIAWRPMSNTEVAVAHETGIIVWNIDPNSLVARPSISNTIILHRIEHKAVMSIVWSPKGDLLVSAAACDNTLLVWDVEMDRTSFLKRPGGNGNVLIKWSPNGEKLLSCTNGVVFRVWDCRNWECERWTVLSGRVQSGCWADNGNSLLFATNNDPVIYSVIVKSDLIFAKDVENASNKAAAIFDVAKVDIDGVMVGGLVQSMESDPKGRQLAVIYQETNCVTVFNVVRQAGLQLIPSSLVVGLPEERPSSVSFQQNFESGSCLTIGWSSGRVQYYPIIYTDLNHTQDNCQLSGNNSTFLNPIMHSTKVSRFL